MAGSEGSGRSQASGMIYGKASSASVGKQIASVGWAFGGVPRKDGLRYPSRYIKTPGGEYGQREVVGLKPAA